MLRLDRKKSKRKSHCSSGVSYQMSRWPDSSVSDTTCSYSLSAFSCNMLTNVPKTSMLLEFEIPEGDVVHFLTVLSFLFGCVFCMLMVLPKKMTLWESSLHHCPHLSSRSRPHLWGNWWEKKMIEWIWVNWGGNKSIGLYACGELWHCNG